MTILHGDCREAMAGMAPNSVDAIVTDPPYGLEFMGKEWDKLGATVEHIEPDSLAAFGGSSPFGGGGQRIRYGTSAKSMQAWHEQWAAEAYRVLKPGGRLLAFGGTRTYHRMVCAIEDAGFVIEDTIAWLYGSGFPKHKSKLKPAHEPICVAWKPDAKATPLNIDACRIEGAMAKPGGVLNPKIGTVAYGDYKGGPPRTTGDGASHPLGRWPANVCLSHHEMCRPCGTKRVKGSSRLDRDSHANDIPGVTFAGTLNTQQSPGYADADGTETVAAWECHPECAIFLLDSQAGERVSKWGKQTGKQPDSLYGGGIAKMNFEPERTEPFIGDTGGASRFFLNVAPDADTVRMRYEAKASRRERNAGLDGLPERVRHTLTGDTRPSRADGERRNEHTPPAPQSNGHPTVKPIALMRWLIRLVAKPGDTVLDPFMGSGSTGCAAALEGVTFVGIEQNLEYLEIAERRIAHWTEHGADALKPKATVRKPVDDSHLALPLFAAVAD